MPSPTIVYASTTALTIQAAWDSLQTKTPLTAVTIEVLAGTYAEALPLTNHPYANMITVQGDTRTAAGSHFATTGSITKSGSDCTITLVDTPPADFTSSDYIIVGGADNPANVGRFPIVAINTGAKTVTYTNAAGVAQAVLANTKVIFCPDRIIDFAGFSHGVTSLCASAPHLTGFTILTSGSGLNGVHVPGPGALNLSKIAVWNVPDSGFYASDGGLLTASGSCTAVKCVGGFMAARKAYVTAHDTYVADCTAQGYLASLAAMVSAVGGIATNSVTGFIAVYGSVISAGNATAARNTTAGFHAIYNGTMQVVGATARNNQTGYLAAWQGVINAANTSANNSGNGTNYTPGTSGTAGATGGIMFFS